MSLSDDLAIVERTAAYEAKAAYEEEARKTKLAIARVEAKRDVKTARWSVLKDEAFLMAAGLVSVILAITFAITYGVTRPEAVPTEAEIRQNIAENTTYERLSIACVESGGTWDHSHWDCYRSDPNE